MTEPVATWTARQTPLDLTDGLLMGVVNVTPDSFSDGSLYLESAAAVARGLELANEGASIVDVGGESTRPGSLGVSAEEEMARVLPVVAALSAEGVVVSIDTSKPEVASAAIGAGASVVNDVTGVGDPEMVDVIAATSVAVVVMHMKGTPRVMQQDPTYRDVVGEIEAFLLQRASALEAEGVGRERIAIDPGIGFGKTLDHNLTLLRHVGRLAGHGYPVVLGTSRKSFLGRLTSIESADDRDGATAVTTALGFAHGARVFRVHDVVASRHALQIAAAIVAAD